MDIDEFGLSSELAFDKYSPMLSSQEDEDIFIEDDDGNINYTDYAKDLIDIYEKEYLSIIAKHEKKKQ